MSTFSLSEVPSTEIEYKGKVYTLIPWFDNVLDCLAAIDGCSEVEAAELLVYYLVDENAPTDQGFVDALKSVFFPNNHNEPQQRAIDMTQDATLIYAAFRQAYGIDLHKEIGKMHWLEFCALLEGLPSGTRLSDIIDIRTRELPPLTRHNAQERMQLLRMKQKYALKISDTERKQNLQRGFAGVARALLAIAKKSKEGGNK